VEDPILMHMHSRHSTHEVELQNNDQRVTISCNTTRVMTYSVFEIIADGWTPLHSWKQHMWRMVVTKAPEEGAFKCTTPRWAKE
jgi:hypothetical protein